MPEPKRMAGQLTAIVAGGGIGGLAAAAALARSGLAVTILERAATLADVGSGLVLYQNGLAAADAISPRLGTRIRSAGHIAGPDDVRLIVSSAGRVLAREPIGATGRSQIAILRTALQDALLDEATAAGAQLRLGLEVCGYTRDAGSVRVRLADGTTMRAHLLVAADGIRSVIRERMLGDGLPRYRGYTSVRGRTTGSWLRPQAFVANGRGIQIFAAPVAASTLYWTAKITAPPGDWPDRGPAEALRALADALAGWHEPIIRLIAGADPRHITVNDIYDRDPVPRWVDDRVALLGDAAHPMTPAMGQGANMALEDAVVLADVMRECATSAGHGDVFAALLAYQRQRAPRTAQVVLMSRRQGELDQGADRLRSLVRDVGMRVRGRKDAAAFDILAWSPPNLQPRDMRQLDTAAPEAFVRPGVERDQVDGNGPAGHIAQGSAAAAQGTADARAKLASAQAAAEPRIDRRTSVLPGRLLCVLAEDLSTVVERDPSIQTRAEAFWHPALPALWIHRFAHVLHGKGLRVTARAMMTVARVLTNVDIHPGAVVGRRVFIDHGAAVVIGETAVIGDDVTIYHQVTLGAVGWWRDNRRAPGERRHPAVGAGVVLGANSTVLGPVTVGDGAVIGAQALVLTDVPADGRAMAPMAQLRSQQEPAVATVHVLPTTASAGS